MARPAYKYLDDFGQLPDNEKKELELLREENKLLKEEINKLRGIVIEKEEDSSDILA